jgi:alcohol dehydrogenase
VSVEQVELDGPGEGEVLVRIRAAGLCHSDLSLVNGHIPRPVPAVVGHESVATVEALGPGVDDLAVGDRVVTVFVPCCGRCSACALGRPGLCEPGGAANAEGTLLGGHRRLWLDGAPLNHHLGVSAFAELAVVSRRSLVPVADDVPDRVAALFGCAVLTGVGAVVNTAGVRPGQSAVVVGLGGVGMSAVLGAVASGASVVAVDLSQDRLELAASLGAQQVFQAADDVAAEIVAATAGGGEHVFEMAGSVAALDLALHVTRRGGTTTVAGIAGPAARYPLAISGLVSQERVIQGSYLGSCVPSRDVPRFMDMYRHGLLPVDRLLSVTGSLEDINAALDSMADHNSGRYVMFP